jgi:integral membrane protein
VKGALLRYQVLATIVGIALVILVFVGIPLQVFAHSRAVVNIDGTIHGFLFIVYLAIGYDLVRRTGWPIWHVIVIAAAGLIPGLTFVVEIWITRRIRRDAAEVEVIDGSEPGT